MKNILNIALHKRKEFHHPNAVRSIEPLCSKGEPFLQMNDVLLGAVGYHCNEGEKTPDAGVAKKRLAAHIAKEAGLAHLKTNTSRSITHFGIWLHQLQSAKK